MIWSYAQTSEFVQNQYTLDKIVFRREPLEDLAKALSSNFLVGFSTYVWNKNYNYSLAKRIKEINPNVLCVFGGPELPITDSKIFEKLPFIDIVIKKEGELVFKEILENLPNIDTVPGLLINRNGVIDTGNAQRIVDLDILPSPYTSGFFDRLVAENPDVEWAATLETNRGCPYQCTFCDWGSLIYSKIKQFNLDRVFKEIEWICQNRCGFLFIADANFGIFPERDNQIVDKLLAEQKANGFPYTFTVSWAKNQKQEVVDIASKLVNAGVFNNGLTISVQTLNEQVLDNIKRKNLNQHKIKEIFDICLEKQVPVTTEVILGLPGETLSSWKNNIYELFESGNHSGVDITQVELLENAEMTQVQKSVYNMKTTEVYDYLGTNVDDYYESISVVNSTRDMPLDDMITAQAFNTFINTFHISGITTIISRFLRKYKNVKYCDFYEDLYSFLITTSWFQDEEEETKKYFRKWMTEGSIDYNDLGIEIHGYNLIYKTLIKLHKTDYFDSLFDQISSWLTRYELDQDLHQDLMNLQKSYVEQYQNINEVKILNVKYDIWNYLLDNPLEVPAQYKLEYVDNKNISNQTFLELLYYGRRRNFGKRKITVCTM